MTIFSISPNLSKHWRFLAFWLRLCFGSCLLFLVCHDTAFLFSTRTMTALGWLPNAHRNAFDAKRKNRKKRGDGLRWKRIQTKIKSFIFQIIFKIRIHHQTRSRTLKLINWFIAEYFTPLFSCFRASEVLRTPDFALNCGCFQVADYENWFCRFSPNRSGLLINKLHHV